MFTILRKIFKWTFYLACVIALIGSICFFWVEKSAEKSLYDNSSQVPSCKTALVLGTSAHLANGTANLYFTYRIDAAVKLYEAKKVKKFILSGDNRVNDYNEPKDMKKALIKRGVPDSCLVLDYAGLRTFDSMVRCKEIFGQDSVIVVSQQFHNARSVFIANKIGLTAFGFNAQKVTTQKTFKMKFREFFSRIKCVLDLYVFNTKPRHLGDKISI
ncbi:MAG: putative rane protein [Bacteroidetes bacterium]|jgi:SanA protein|nr:putative rane protein [Bacteroidota bacterium]